MVIFTTLLKSAERTCQICPRRTVALKRIDLEPGYLSSVFFEITGFSTAPLVFLFVDSDFSGRWRPALRFDWRDDLGGFRPR